MVEEHRTGPGILGKDQVDLLQHRNRTKCEVGEVADGRGDEVEHVCFFLSDGS
jgi:hypothetical protein